MLFFIKQKVASSLPLKLKNQHAARDLTYRSADLNQYESYKAVLLVHDEC